MGTVASSSGTSCEFGGICDEISGKTKNKETVESVNFQSEPKISVPKNTDVNEDYIQSEGLTKNAKPFEGFKSNDDLYPERKGGKFEPTWFQTIFLGESRRGIDKARCERNVMKCVDSNPLIKLMLSALKSSGCEVDLLRHISCECCSKKVSGGYDANLNQIVICQNVARSEAQVIGSLAHELVHMFDYCRVKLDLANIEHLACTEIRAANLMHCSFMSAMIDGSASPINIAERHKECVKKKAIASVLAVRDISKEEAVSIVDRVFTRCYNDLEPLGRRIRRNSLDIEKAYRERYHYGYED